tara:strand:+ start:2997 stop:3419 length:423 start_codon:yes stop_codon:yes gene_type:complete
MTKIPIVCFPRDESDIGPPTKVFGTFGKQCRIWIKNIDKMQLRRIEIEEGYLPEPNQPSFKLAHYGYLESGIMKILMTTDSSTIHIIKAGQTYYIPPNHVTIFEKKSSLIEFSHIGFFGTIANKCSTIANKCKNIMQMSK